MRFIQNTVEWSKGNDGQSGWRRRDLASIATPLYTCLHCTPSLQMEKFTHTHTFLCQSNLYPLERFFKVWPDNISQHQLIQMCYVIPLNKCKCIFGTRLGSFKQMKIKYILALWDGKCITPSVNKIIGIILIWQNYSISNFKSIQIILSDLNGYTNSAWFTAWYAVCLYTWIPVKVLQHFRSVHSSLLNVVIHHSGTCCTTKAPSPGLLFSVIRGLCLC